MERNALNVNYGIMGHVDSGKTSLSKALSDTASTACFDKNPQSQERGITMDLGFSCFSVPIPEHLMGNDKNILQVTLVDCPGHASFLKTVIGGSKIIDMVLLVIDATRGIQIQTAECLVIAEILQRPLIIALNKVDLFPFHELEASIEKSISKVRRALSKTPFSNCIIVPVSANLEFHSAHQSVVRKYHPDCLKAALASNSVISRRSVEGPFIFAVDHCFAIKGQGTILTGTVLQGSIKVGELLHIPSIKESRKIRSIQVFRKPVKQISQGDRGGIGIHDFDPKSMERGLVTSANSSFLTPISTIVASLKLISYYKKDINSGIKVHISVSHEVALATILLFGDITVQHQAFSPQALYPYIESINSSSKDFISCLALIHLEKPIHCPPNSLVIGLKLDADMKKNVCRLMFYGTALEMYNCQQFAELKPKLNLFTIKSRKGVVERSMDENIVLVRDLTPKKMDLSCFFGLKVTLSTGEEGEIVGTFGRSGKVKVRVSGQPRSPTLSAFMNNRKSKKAANSQQNESCADRIQVTLTYKKFVYNAKGRQNFIQ